MTDILWPAIGLFVECALVGFGALFLALLLAEIAERLKERREG